MVRGVGRVSSVSSTTSGKYAPKPAAWAYCEDYVPDSETSTLARRAAADLRLAPPSRGAAQVLTFLARVVDARSAVQVGTGTGVAALALLTGMHADGVLTTIDPEPEHQNIARQIITGTGIRPQRLRTIAGAPLTVLPKLSDAAYDLVLIDGDPLEAHECLEQALRLLRPGGVLVLHHALMGGTVAEPTNQSDEAVITREVLQAVHETRALTPVLLPVGDGILAAVKNA